MKIESICEEAIDRLKRVGTTFIEIWWLEKMLHEHTTKKMEEVFIKNTHNPGFWLGLGWSLRKTMEDNIDSDNLDDWKEILGLNKGGGHNV